MQFFIDTLLAITEGLGYWGILILMTVESSFVPFPSELVVPPAAYLSSKGEMNLWIVIIAGVAGSVLGALINYAIARYFGRSVVYAIAKHNIMRYLLITHHKLKNVEDIFLKYGNISTFIGRLIIGVRQLISIPAGFAKMPVGAFVFYTFLGSSVWVPVLAMHGYLLGEHEPFVRQYWLPLILGYVFLVIAIAIGVFVWKRRRG